MAREEGRGGDINATTQATQSMGQGQGQTAASAATPKVGTQERAVQAQAVILLWGEEPAKLDTVGGSL